MNDYVKYIPLICVNPNEYIAEPKLNTEKHKENISKILKQEKKEMKVQNNEIFIKRSLAYNKKLVCAYTNKANEFEYVKYIPIILKNPNIGYVEIQSLKIPIVNMKLILSHYNEKYKIINNELYITKRLALDKEMVHNYTQHAVDTKMIKQIKTFNRKQKNK